MTEKLTHAFDCYLAHVELRLFEKYFQVLKLTIGNFILFLKIDIDIPEIFIHMI